jgi:hypothetical protein
MYLSECLERDSAKAVGLGLPMWVMLIAFVLVSGERGSEQACCSLELFLSLTSLGEWRYVHTMLRLHDVTPRWVAF